MRTALALGFLWLVTSLAPAGNVATASHYLDAAAIDLKTLLADPPADQSDITHQEIAVLLDRQAHRTPEQIARAAAEAKMNVFIFADVLGPWFTPEKLPQTAALLFHIEDDTKSVSEQAKVLWHRPRPPLQDSRIHPAVELPKTASYPSGHSTRGTVFALVLAELAPDLKSTLIARGELIGEDRLAAGVHFPSDVAAGRVLGRALFERLMASPQFQSDLTKARAEFVAVRPKR